MKLFDYIKTNRLFLDGALGTRLIALGYDTNDAAMLNITAPGVLFDIYTSYLKAGSKLIYANTFGANSRKIKDKSLLKKVITEAVAVAKRAAEPYGAYVGYDCGPVGELLEPYSRLTLEEAYNIFAEQAEIVKDLGVDCVAIETMTDILEMKTALLAFKENTGLPVICSMSFSEGGRTFTGSGVAAFCLTAQGNGADAVGINCSLGADKAYNLVKELIKYANVPVFVKPNAGMPVFKGGKTYYDTGAEEFSDYMVKIAELGVSALGGCCGTDETYIKKLVEKTKDIPFKIFSNNIDALCGAREVLPLYGFKVIGERLNPTGKPLLKKAIAEDDYDYITSLCVEQVSDGADILDVNAGMGGIDEGEKLKNIVLRAQTAVGAPLQIDTVKKDALEKALRALGGIGIVNSVSAEKASLDAVLPLVKKYGAYVVGLCLDDKGIPATPGERVKLAEKIIKAAEDYGIDRRRVLIDPLTLAVSVDKDNPKITLETLELIKEKLGVRTVIGLSNVSFGLPDREIINAQFYKMALEAGLDFAIINPKLKPAEDAYAKDMLCGLDADCSRYIASRQNQTQKEVVKTRYTLKECVLKGLKAEAADAVRSAANKDNYNNIINDDIIGALNELGKLYEEGKAFLPQLIAGSEAAKAALSYVKENFIKESGSRGETIVMATVRGDIHDLGKNIVKAVLSNYGYKIIDLGKDVPAGEIISAAKKHNPRYIGLSALMTTTLDSMKEIVGAVKEYDKDIITIVGGAAVTADFAQSIGADIYGKDAQDAVNRLKEYKKK